MESRGAESAGEPTEDGASELLPVATQVSLAARAGRRREGQSQRELAEALGWSKSKVGRLEHDPSGLRFGDVVEAVARAGFRLVVVAESQTAPEPPWEETDLVATDRSGRRFPAHLSVVASPMGPFWWWEQEFIRLARPLGPQPRWTTEGSLARSYRTDLRQDVENAGMAPTSGLSDPPGSPER